MGQAVREHSRVGSGGAVLSRRLVAHTLQLLKSSLLALLRLDSGLLLLQLIQNFPALRTVGQQTIGDRSKSPVLQGRLRVRNP